jgi:hypothetical protein
MDDNATLLYVQPQSQSFRENDNLVNLFDRVRRAIVSGTESKESPRTRVKSVMLDVSRLSPN